MHDAWWIGSLYSLLGKLKTIRLKLWPQRSQSAWLSRSLWVAFAVAGGFPNANKFVHLRHFRCFVAPLGGFGEGHLGTRRVQMAAEGKPHGHEQLLKWMAKSVPTPMPEKYWTLMPKISQNCATNVKQFMRF